MVILALTFVFAVLWALAHWNLSRKPPYHKGPGSAGYVDPVLPLSSEQNKSE